MAIACPINAPVEQLKSVANSLDLQLVSLALLFRREFVSTSVYSWKI